MCSTPHQITASDFNLSTSPLQKPIVVGGLSSLFSGKADDFSSLRHDHRSEDSKDLSFTSSFSYSPARFSYHRREHHQSPISVLHGPVSCSCSPPMRSFHGSYRVGGANRLFNRFVTKAVGSCVDYELGLSSSDELTFPMDDGCGVDTKQPYTRDLLRRAQLRHKIFEDESVIKAFYEAEIAHRRKEILHRSFHILRLVYQKSELDSHIHFYIPLLLMVGWSSFISLLNLWLTKIQEKSYSSIQILLSDNTL